MTWQGEAASGAIPYYTEDGTFGAIPIGPNGHFLSISNGMPTWMAMPNNGGSGTINFKTTVKPAINLSSLLTWTYQNAKPAVVVTQSPSTLLSLTKPSFRISTSLSGVAVNQLVNSAVKLSGINSGISSKPSGIPAAKIVSINYNLTHRAGATGVSSSAIWTNLNNASGIHDGVSSSFAGDLLNARDGTLTLNYADFSNKDSLTITGVFLHFYVQSAGTVLSNGDLRLQDNNTVLETITNNVNALTTPRTFDRTAQYPTWTSLNGLVTKVRGLTDIGETLISYNVDAVEVQIMATG